MVTNFDYDADTEEFVITLEDGTEKRVSVSAFIKETEFVNSNTIVFNVNNHVVSASVANHSIGEDQMVNSYLSDVESARDDAIYAKDDAEDSMQLAQTYAQDSESSSYASEAWAIGKSNGVDVPSTHPAYHNNSLYWKNQAQSIVGGDDNVKYTSQSKTDSEKAIARANIDAISGKFDKSDDDWTVNTDISMLEDGFYTISGASSYDYDESFPDGWNSDGMFLIMQTDTYNMRLYTFIGFKQNDENESYIWQAYTDSEPSKYEWSKIGGSGTEVIDNLTSTSTTSALSANQGRVLNDLIDNKLSKVSSTTTNNFASFNSDGSLKDSGRSENSFENVMTKVTDDSQTITYTLSKNYNYHFQM